MASHVSHRTTFLIASIVCYGTEALKMASHSCPIECPTILWDTAWDMDGTPIV